MKGDLDAAIERIKKSRLSHQLWVEYFEEHPELESEYEITVGSKERNLRVIEEYDNVLLVLESTRLG